MIRTQIIDGTLVIVADDMLEARGLYARIGATLPCGDSGVVSVQGQPVRIIIKCPESLPPPATHSPVSDY